MKNIFEYCNDCSSIFINWNEIYFGGNIVDQLIWTWRIESRQLTIQRQQLIELCFEGMQFLNDCSAVFILKYGPNRMSQMHAIVVIRVSALREIHEYAIQMYAKHLFWQIQTFNAGDELLSNWIV